MKRQHSLAELFSEVAVEVARLQPPSLEARLADLLRAEPMRLDEAATRLGSDAAGLAAIVAADPFGFVALGEQIGLAANSRSARVRDGGDAAPSESLQSPNASDASREGLRE